MTARHFAIRDAVRTAVPVLVGIYGPSGSGKSVSALRLAAGIQKVCGGDIHAIDTEARRMLHYADKWKFKHMEFTPPFGPDDYREAIETCVKAGAKIIIVDTASLEHEGEGGVLETHDAEVQRMGGEKHNFRAWAKPKAARRKLINRILQLDVHVIFCFRAREKAKPERRSGGGEGLTDLGWMPIAGEEFLYEMTVNVFLPPGANGIPDWNPKLPGERQMVKLPEQFRASLSDGKQMSEAHGEQLARWAAGGAAPAKAATPAIPPAGAVSAPSMPGEVFRFPGGPHRGKTMREVPIAYLETVRDNKTNSQRSRDLADAEIKRRDAGEVDEADLPPLPEDER